MIGTHRCCAATALMLMTLSRSVGAQPASPMPSSTPTALERVKSLYESASYAEALVAIDRTALPPARASSTSVVLQRYRALCLIALDRAEDAEREVEQLLMQEPQYTADATDTSPRFLAVLSQARGRVLPRLAQQDYEDAKRRFSERRFEDASRGFARVLTLLDHPALDEDSRGSVRDLRTLAAGFLELSRASAPEPRVPERAMAEPVEPTGQSAAAWPAEPVVPVAPVTPAEPPAVQRPRSPAADVERTPALIPPPLVYSAADRDVTPPETLRQDLPEWRLMSATPLRFPGRYEGLVDLVIDETGSVESATLVKSIFPTYNALALGGTKHWKYTPATKNGMPVKYRKSVQVSLVIPE